MCSNPRATTSLAGGPAASFAWATRWKSKLPGWTALRSRSISALRLSGRRCGLRQVPKAGRINDESPRLVRHCANKPIHARAEDTKTANVRREAKFKALARAIALAAKEGANRSRLHPVCVRRRATAAPSPLPSNVLEEMRAEEKLAIIGDAEHQQFASWFWLFRN